MGIHTLPTHDALLGVSANDHHAQAHVITGADHTASGLTAGHVMRATAATTFGFGAIQDTDIPATIARDSEVTSAVAAHVDDTTDAHDASAISVADAGGYLTATEVEAALQELAARQVFEWVFRKAGTLSVTTNVGEYFRAGFACRITEVQVHVGTAPTGAALIVDVNDDGTTVFTTQGNRPQVADGANDDTSGTPDGGTSVVKDSVITIDVDQVGSGTAGADLTVHVRGRYIP